MRRKMQLTVAVVLLAACWSTSAKASETSYQAWRFMDEAKYILSYTYHEDWYAYYAYAYSFYAEDASYEAHLYYSNAPAFPDQKEEFLRTARRYQRSATSPTNYVMLFSYYSFAHHYQLAAYYSSTGDLQWAYKHQDLMIESYYAYVYAYYSLVYLQAY